MRDAHPLKIGLKYCGGCTPDYDRVALVEEIAARIAPDAVLVRPDSGELDLVLAVQGCPTACADLTPFTHLPVWTITCPEGAEAFIQHIETFLRKETAMKLSRDALQRAIENWNVAWANYDLEGVLALMSEDIVFDNWTGGQARGKEKLRQAWGPWFAQGDFSFIHEDLFIDEAAQKVLFRWRLEWPCREKGFERRLEKRRGVDVMHFRDGRMVEKLTYSKTTIEIDGQRHALHV
ncbi:YybH family protein [Desulfatitalea tepidiphila]|uniref:YybH family protein n=1 Tax=Desulfatitalea tepidiphila TaxID=1185843 RepID=UPI0006B5D439|nr:nuclear transport factor 2 family protein [Desulfatitalea tepidiphila]